jgi:hypothetical protein
MLNSGKYLKPYNKLQHHILQQGTSAVADFRIMKLDLVIFQFLFHYFINRILQVTTFTRTASLLTVPSSVGQTTFEAKWQLYEPSSLLHKIGPV